jgi:hypothetical protein
MPMGAHEDDNYIPADHSLDSRVLRLEARFNQIYTTAHVTRDKVDNLVEAFKSRLKAFEAGQDLILRRLEEIESVKDQAAGALFVIKLLGVTGTVGGIIAIIKIIAQR